MGFYKFSYLFLFIYCTSGVFSNSVIIPCKIEDISCIDTSAHAAIPKLNAGFPELGVKSSDPLYIERIEDSVIIPCKIEDISCIDTSAHAAIPKLNAGFPELGVKSSDPLYIERIEDSVIIPCKLGDLSCIYNSAHAAIPKLIAGFPELGVKSSDPLYIERIEGIVPKLKYVFTKTTVTGFKNCAISNIQIDPEFTHLYYELNCPSVRLEGQYEMSGELISIPVEGQGHFTITTGAYYITVNSKLQTTSIDGKIHLNIKVINVTDQGLAPVKYAFDNMYNGDQGKADTFHNSAHENWENLQEQAADPAWLAIFENIMGNFNDYFDKILFKDLISS